MLTLICAFAAGIAAGLISGFWTGVSWGAAIGLLVFMCIQASAALVIRSKSKKLNAVLQAIMEETRKRIELQQNRFLRTGSQNQKQLLAIVLKEQRTGLEQAIAACDSFRSLYKWNFFLKKQMNTMKMAFYYQMGNFTEVDRLMPDCVILDPQTLCMKMARMFKLNATQQEIDRFFKKKCRRLKAENYVLPVSLYAWILVKQNRLDEAVKLLAAAKLKTSDDVIAHNWEALANGKPKQFSNAGLTERWYALALEEPKMPKMQQQRYVYR